MYLNPTKYTTASAATLFHNHTKFDKEIIPLPLTFTPASTKSNCEANYDVDNGHNNFHRMRETRDEDL